MKLKTLKQRLQKLQETDNTYRLLGSRFHGYKNHPISEAELQDLEQFLGVDLPREYRLFMKEVGYGAGIGHGLFSPAEIKQQHQKLIWEKCFNIPGVDYEEYYKNQNGDYTIAEKIYLINSFADISYKDIRDFIERYKNAISFSSTLSDAAPNINYLKGGVVIGHQGDDDIYILIVEGEMEGCIFRSNYNYNAIPEGVIYQKTNTYKADIDGDVFPFGGEIAFRLKPLTFRQWYEEWLRSYLQAAHQLHNTKKNY
jgi:hypothetical protein